MFVLGALLVAIIKPWGAPVATTVVVATPSPSLSLSPSASASVPPEIGFSSLQYDPSIFGNHEPAPTWAIWPAGYLVTFGFVVQVPGTASTVPQGSASPSARPHPTPTATAGAAAARSPSPGPGQASDPDWPTRFVVPEGNHLFLIGINMPRGYSVGSAQLGRYGPDGNLVSVDVERLQSPWPEHFAVIGIPTSSGEGRLDVWTPGLYRLDLDFEPGAISPSFEVLIAGPTDGP